MTDWNLLIIAIGFLATVSFGIYSLRKTFVEYQRLVNHRLLIDTILPNRLQAYERFFLLLERMSPNSLIPRMRSDNATVSEWRQMLLRTIREELEHNHSKQMYISRSAWEHVIESINGIMMLINQSAEELPAEAPASELSRKILYKMIEAEEPPTSKALQFLRNEVDRLLSTPIADK